MATEFEQNATSDADNVAAESPATTSIFKRMLWCPPWTRWDPDAKHELDWSKIILFALTAACSVANLYYSYPILNVLAHDFGVTDERASLVPTITQAGYACGLLFVIPIGDLVPRRPFILVLMTITAVLWLGCTLTSSFSAFLGLCFVVGVTTLMFPLTTQYAPQKHKAMMISIVMSGIVFGIVVVRILAGVVAQFTSWRVVYWVSLGWQLLIIALLFLTMPDYPILRPGTSYPAILLKIVKLPFQYPVLTQQSLIAFMVMAVYTNFWTTLTFQLAHVFSLTTLSIGLFALIGLGPVLLNPFISRVLTSRVHPTGTLLVALTTAITGACVGTFAGTVSLAGPVVWALLGDLAMNTSVVASRMAFSHVEPSAQNAVNAVYMVFTFCGQLCGTAAGNALYARHGGWLASGGLAIGMLGVAIVLCVARGPHEAGWVGWKGGQPRILVQCDLR
ncbi:major facilitator superfamily domain-containing protein [Microdochium trichocladiopsis]|uniref:Major facilitator superfamily domain-containing protein n=1 Tax=Microdochium trichocladiopsis TaxID=1682393 RepID=A0A9P8Y307_9PEZI|nr:major facilitator superfamily domain-containing protein [Microdochium trichocladiopsis]KAH7027963.1 major facilitator superfamily domain-containing protein [Microdochium trichocladiopsis]